MLPKSAHLTLYRVAQFFSALKAYLPGWAGGLRGVGLTGDDASLVNAILDTPARQALFERMPPNDQRHAIAVIRTLKQAGYDQPELMQAGLLHDVGKSLGQPIGHRVLIVLLEAFYPELLHRLSTSPVSVDQVGWWRRPFVVHAQHPAIGAAWARAAGCESGAVELILRHQESLESDPGPDRRFLAALQWADDLN